MIMCVAAYEMKRLGLAHKKCTEKQRLSLQNLFAQVDGFMPTCWADKEKTFFATSATVGGLYGEETVTFQLPDLFQ